MFLRWSPGLNADLIIMPSLPGAERRPRRWHRYPAGDRFAAGISHGRQMEPIATSDTEHEDEPQGLFLVSTATGEKRRLTRPTAGSATRLPRSHQMGHDWRSFVS